MSIEFEFSAKFKNKEAFLGALGQLCQDRGYTLQQQEDNLWVTLCPMGVMPMALHEEKSLFGKQWLVTGECYTTPAGAGLHKAGIELLDGLASAVKNLQVEDLTGYYSHRNFERLKQAHFYPWLDSLIHMSSEYGYTNFCLCWDLTQYQPEEVPGTVITPMGRFRVQTVLDVVEQLGLRWFAERFFLWDNEEKDARYYRNKAMNALWETCHFVPSSRRPADAACNKAIIADLERAAALDPTLPLPLSAYGELCALDGHTPAIPATVTELESEFPIGYRKGAVQESIGSLRLTVPGRHCYEWESRSDGSGNHLWYGIGDDPIWRVTEYRRSNGEDATLSEQWTGDSDIERLDLPHGKAIWGWKPFEEDGHTFYQVRCEAVCGPCMYIVSATYMRPDQQEDIYAALRTLKLVKQEPPVTHQRSYDTPDQ